MPSGAFPDDQIILIYQSVLRRDADPSGLSSLVAQFNAGLSLDSIRDAIVASSEASSFVDPIIRLYEVAFGRQADEAGLTNWVNAFRNGTSFETIALGFTGSQEFINRFGTSTDRSAFVESLYVNGLGRASDAEGKANWVASTLSDAQLLLGFSESIESIARLESDTTAYLVNLSNGIAADTTASLTSLTNSTNSIDSDSGGGSGDGDSSDSDSGGGGYARPIGDTLKDFAGGDDLFGVKAFGFAAFTEGTSDASQVDGEKLIQSDIDYNVTLLGVSTVGDLQADDVLL